MPPPCKPKVEGITFHWGDGTFHMGSIRGKAHPLPHTHTWQWLAHQWGDGTLHAWVRFGAKLTEPCHDTPPTVSIPVGRWNVTHWFDSQESSPPAHETHIAKVSIPVGRWRKCGRRFKMRALTSCDAKTRARTQQPVSARVSPRGRWMKCHENSRKV